MRILQVLHGWPPSRMGGTGLYVDALTRALGQANHSARVIAPKRGFPSKIEAVRHADIEGWLLLTPPATTWAAGWRRAKGLQPWRALLQEWRPNVVHLHHLSGLPMNLLGVAKEQGVRTVLTLHDYALPCPRGQLVNQHRHPCEGPSPSRCSPCVFGEKGTLRTRLDKRRIRERFAAVQAVFSAADVVLSPSEDLATRMTGFGFARPTLCELPILQAPIPVVEPGVGPLRFLFASAMIPTKGPHLSLDAFAQLPLGPTLTIAGPSMRYDGDTGFVARLEAKAANTPNVRLAGAIDPAQVPRLLADHDVLLLPSIWPENSPLIVREAAAAGLRVIASRAGGAGELCPSATLIDPTDPRALLGAMADAVERGRGRAPTVQSKTPKEHALWLLENAYSFTTGYTGHI
jgi:glycosyltransferase involved in cell wall biosynthesis